MPAPVVAYLTSRFPHLPETFILREIVELERQGWAVAFYPLIVQQQAVMHAEARPWLARVKKIPFVSAGILRANLRALRLDPRRYAAVWRQALWECRASPNLLLRAVALLPRAAYLAEQMQRRGVAHVHAHYATHPALVAWAIHRLTGLSYSLTVHAHDIFVRTAMLATKLREASFVAAISQYNREHLAKLAGPWVREKTHIVHCGIQPERYAPRPAPPPPGERFEILTIGSLQPYKGQRFLVEACRLLRDRGLAFRCRIIGGGEEEAALRRQIVASGLVSYVELIGPRPQEEVAQLLPGAHCYVQPSVVTKAGKMEGIPVSLMEAMACAVPVVATALSGMPELVRPGETGLLVPASDPAALAEALAQVQAAPEEAAGRARAGRELVLREFELEANVSRLAQLFAQVTGQAKPGSLSSPGDPRATES